MQFPCRTVDINSYVGTMSHFKEEKPVSNLKTGHIHDIWVSEILLRAMFW